MAVTVGRPPKHPRSPSWLKIRYCCPGPFGRGSMPGPPRCTSYYLMSRPSLQSAEASALCGGSLFHGPAERAVKSSPSNMIKTWLMDLETVPSEVSCGWPFEELLLRVIKYCILQWPYTYLAKNLSFLYRFDFCSLLGPCLFLCLPFWLVKQNLYFSTINGILYFFNDFS